MRVTVIVLVTLLVAMLVALILLRVSENPGHAQPTATVTSHATPLEKQRLRAAKKAQKSMKEQPTATPT